MKAFYRRAIAYKMLKDYKHALEDISKAYELNPDDEIINKEYNVIKVILIIEHRN